MKSRTLLLTRGKLGLRSQRRPGAYGSGHLGDTPSRRAGMATDVTDGLDISLKVVAGTRNHLDLLLVG